MNFWAFASESYARQNVLIWDVVNNWDGA